MIDIKKYLRSMAEAADEDGWVQISDKRAVEAADRIEKLEAEEIEFDRVIGNYASENALFRDRIEKLEAALRTVKEWHGYGLPPETTRIIDAALDAE